jgi:phage terminase small subunit
MGKKIPSLTPKPGLFVLEYAKDHNATQAAIRAGYSPKTARQQASRLLSNVAIQDAIQQAIAAQKARLQVEADDILREALLIARSDIGDILDFAGEQPRLRPAREIPERARRAIGSVKVRRHLEGAGDDAREVEVTEFKLWDKLGAIDKLMRHLGLLVTKVEHSGKEGGPIQYIEMPLGDDSEGQA